MYLCGVLTLAKMLGHSLCLLYLSGKGERIGWKAHGSGCRLGDCLSVNIMRKNQTLFGENELLIISVISLNYSLLRRNMGMFVGLLLSYQCDLLGRGNSALVGNVLLTCFPSYNR